MSQATRVQGWSELLLALPEFVLIDAKIDEHDELVAEVELPRDVQPCIRCGTIEQHRIHDWRTHTVHHLPVAGRASRVVWRKRLLECLEGCGTFVERTSSIAPGAVWSRAAVRAAVALSEGQRGDRDDPPPVRGRLEHRDARRGRGRRAGRCDLSCPTRVGIDETVMVTGKLTTRRRASLTALVCLDTSLVVAVTQGRDRGSAARLLAEHAPDAEVVACDLFSGFKSAADTLEGAVVVADVFPREIGAAGARRGPTSPAAADPRPPRPQGRPAVPVLRRVLRVGQERLDDATVTKIFERLREADTDDEVAAAWVAVDLLRKMYASPDRDTAHRRLVAFYEWAVTVEVAEVTRLARTIDTWQDEVLAFFDTRASNAPTESAIIGSPDPGVVDVVDVAV